MMFEPIAGFLEGEIPFLKEGETLFVNHMPLDVDLGLLLKESFGGTEVDGELIGRRRGRFQVVVRGRSYLDCKALIENASSILTLVEHQLPGMLIRNMRQLTDTVTYPLSVGNNHEMSVNFSAIYDIVQE